MRRPPKRYLNGIVIAIADSREYLGDTNKDYKIKRLIVAARPASCEKLIDVDGYELIATIEVETFDIDDHGNDHGAVETACKIYTTPFPHNVRLRKEMLRLLASQPSFWRA